MNMGFKSFDKGIRCNLVKNKKENITKCTFILSLIVIWFKVLLQSFIRAWHTVWDKQLGCDNVVLINGISGLRGLL